jgi:hypothetical protein
MFTIQLNKYTHDNERILSDINIVHGQNVYEIAYLDEGESVSPVKAAFRCSLQNGIRTSRRRSLRVTICGRRAGRLASQISSRFGPRIVGHGAADVLCKIAHLNGFVVFSKFISRTRCIHDRNVEWLPKPSSCELFADYVGSSGDSLRSRADPSLSSDPPNTLGNR